MFRVISKRAADAETPTFIAISTHTQTHFFPQISLSVVKNNKNKAGNQEIAL